VNVERFLTDVALQSWWLSLSRLIWVFWGFPLLDSLKSFLSLGLTRSWSPLSWCWSCSRAVWTFFGSENSTIAYTPYTEPKLTLKYSLILLSFWLLLHIWLYQVNTFTYSHLYYKCFYICFIKMLSNAQVSMIICSLNKCKVCRHRYHFRVFKSLKRYSTFFFWK